MPVYPLGMSIVSGRQDHGTVVSNVLNVDPLAGLPFALRLQPNSSFSAPLGLYQDTACTIPATADGDTVAAWRDELSNSGITALQSTFAARPMLVFDGGIPTVFFDGVDDVLSYVHGASTWLPQPSQYIVVISVQDSGARRFISSRNTGIGRNLLYQQGGNFQLFCGSNINGGAGDDGWHTWSAKCNGASSSTR